MQTSLRMEWYIGRAVRMKSGVRVTDMRNDEKCEAA